MSAGQLRRNPGALFLDSPSLGAAIGIALAFAACHAAGQFATRLSHTDTTTSVALFGASAGLALAILLRFGVRLWPGVFLGTFTAALSAGATPGLAAMIASGNTVGPVLGALVLQRGGLNPALARGRDVWRYGCIGVGLALAVSTSNSVFWRLAVGQIDWALAPRAWLHGWLGDAAVALVLGIPLLTASRSGWRGATAPSTAISTSIKDGWPGALLGLATLGSAALSTRTFGDATLPSPWLFLTPLLLAWLAARSGLFVASLCTALLSATWAVASLDGSPPFLDAGFLSVGAAMPTQAFGANVTYSLAYLASLLAAPLLVTVFTAEIARLEQRWRQTFDSSQIGLGEWDLRRGRIEFSPRWLALMRRAEPAVHADLAGAHDAHSADDSLATFWSRVHVDDVEALQATFERLRAPDRAPEGAFDGAPEGALYGAPEGALERARDGRLRHPRSSISLSRMACGDGVWRHFELHAQVTDRSAAGEPLRIVITARLAEQAVAPPAPAQSGEPGAALASAQLSPGVLENLHEGVLITDAAHRVLEVNPTFARITGHSREEIMTLGPALLRPAEPGTAAARQQFEMTAALAADDVWRGEMRGQRRDGFACLLQVTVSVLRHADGSVRNFVYAMADITDARQQLEQLQRQAHFDELTRLPNRTRLSQMLDAALQTSRRDGTLLTVCYLDLDHFKPVNDQYGHDAGDRLLLELANRMRRSLRSWAGGDDVVARIGGDEFVLLLRTATVEESRHAVERVLSQICQPYALGVSGGPVRVTASIGATVFPLDGADADTLLRHADHAMYGAKQAGRNGYLFFDTELNRRTEARFVALGRVQEALDANEFRLYFQPKVDMRLGTVLGMEALLRWNHPEKGVIAPGHFLPLIENTGLSGSVGNWVLQNGIDQLAQWLREGLDLGVSINVSARHLQDPLFAQQLAGLLSRHDASVARHLTIEVLETAALADVDYTCALMQECRALGVRFALDDFGTGYSTFTYLKRLPIDMLKIDRSFVTNMLSDRQDLAIVEGVIGLSQTFGCTVVAEGVETPEQAQRLIKIGCEVGQGNGIAAAMPADQVAAWVRGYDGLVRDVAPVAR